MQIFELPLASTFKLNTKDTPVTSTFLKLNKENLQGLLLVQVTNVYAEKRKIHLSILKFLEINGSANTCLRSDELPCPLGWFIDQVFCGIFLSLSAPPYISDIFDG